MADTPAVRPTPAGRLMTFPPLAAVYERAWRPLFRLWTTVGVDEEIAYAIRDLALASPDVRTVLDVACGPGNLTRSLAAAMVRGGRSTALVIGVDVSPPMMARAVADTTDHDHVAYTSGDARSLPFADDSVDAVCCYAALYLVPDPFDVLADMIRVLRPGGRIAIMTTVRRGPAVVGSVTAAAAATVGLEMFDRDSVTSFLAARDVEFVEQRVHGVAQFVTGRLAGPDGAQEPVSAP